MQNLAMAERMGFEPMCPLRQTDFESSVKKWTWRNLTEDKGNSENPKNPDVFRDFLIFIEKNTVKIRV